MSAPDGDVLFRGSDTPARRPSPYLLLAVVFLAGALLAWRLAGTADPAARVAPNPPTASASTARPSPSAPAASRSVPATLRLPLPPEDVLPMGETTSARLVLAGRTLVDIALDSGDVTTTAPAGRILQAVRVRAGDFLLVADPSTSTRSAVFAGNGRAELVPLGPARALVPAADDRHVWLEVPSPAGSPKVLTKVDQAGRFVSTASLGSWRAAVRETPHGMVTISNSYFSQSLELWDIDRRRVATTYWVAASLLVVAADANHTAFVLPYCTLRLCPMKLADLGRGDVLDLTMPEHWETNAAAFSPDGSRLAVLGRQLFRGVDSGPDLVVVDLRSRAARTVAGVEALTSRSSLLTWSPDSRWFFAAAGPDAAPLLGYRVGDRRVRYVPLPRGAQGVDPADLTSLTAY